MPEGELTWPEQLGGGSVYDPVGVIHGGDLVDDGSTEEWSWSSYTHLFGATSKCVPTPTTQCPRLRWPVIAEGHGNHDGSNSTHEDGRGWFVDKNTRSRNQQRYEEGMLTEVSANGLHSSWDWSFGCNCAPLKGQCSLHLVHLGLYSGDTCQGCGDDGNSCFYGKACYGGFVYPEESYSFLAQDLAKNVGKSGRPVVIIQHYGFDGFSIAWYSPAERAALFELLRGYNVIGIFVGHTHCPQIYKWNGTHIGAGLAGPALDVYNLDATVKVEPGIFAVELWGNGTFRLAHRQTSATSSQWGNVQARKAVALEERCPVPASTVQAEEYVHNGEIGGVDPFLLEELAGMEKAAAAAKVLQREARAKHGKEQAARVHEVVAKAKRRRSQ
eukprot:gene11918-14076_t